jgi:hypothetical protein
MLQNKIFLVNRTFSTDYERVDEVTDLTLLLQFFYTLNSKRHSLIIPLIHVTHVSTVTITMLDNNSE